MCTRAYNTRAHAQVALSATIQLDLGTTLLLSGLYNVASGVGFQIPMCVQVGALVLSSSGWLRLRVCAP